jgi:fucose 4-O-acetylase-like acetyltransferase
MIQEDCTQNEKNQRLDWIDAGKGLGITLVVLGHAISGNLETRAVENFIWSFHMPAFFFLSGFVDTSLRTNPARPYLRTLSQSIVLPYFYLAILSYAVWLTTDKDNCIRDCVSWSTPAIGTFYGISGTTDYLIHNTPLWFLTCLASVKLINFIIEREFEASLTRWGLMLTGAAAGHAWLNYELPRLPWNAELAFISGLFFLFGKTLKNHRFFTSCLKMRKRNSILPIFVLFLVVAIISAENGRIDLNLAEFGNPLLFYTGAISGTLLLTLLSKHWLTNKPLILLGKASLVILSFHLLLPALPTPPKRLLSIVGWYAQKIHVEALPAYITALASTLQQLLLCSALYFFIAKFLPQIINLKKSSTQRH